MTHLFAYVAGFRRRTPAEMGVGDVAQDRNKGVTAGVVKGDERDGARQGYNREIRRGVPGSER